MQHFHFLDLIWAPQNPKENKAEALLLFPSRYKIIQLPNGLLNLHYMVGIFLGTGNTEVGKQS